MPKRTIVNEPRMNYRTRNIPVSLIQRIRALAFALGETEEGIVNQCLSLGLDYLEGANDYLGED